jgi:hypothetical protein
MDYPDQSEPGEPRPHHHGCLWGCLGLVLIVGLGIASMLGYSMWYVYTGFKNDPRLQSIMEVVRHDPRAEDVLGRNIHIVEVETHTFAFSTGLGDKATYTLRLAGSSGDGELKVDMDLSKKPAKVTVMVLTGEDGHPHYLVGGEPKSPMMDSI